jgi:small subunit ribosomal protein S1
MAADNAIAAAVDSDASPATDIAAVETNAEPKAATAEKTTWATVPTRRDNASATTAAKPEPKSAKPVEAQSSPKRDGRVWRSDALPGPVATNSRQHDAPAVQDHGPDPTTEDFAALLGDAPINVTHYEPGDRVKAVIVGRGDGVLFVSLGGKSEGVVDTAGFVDEEGALTVAVGDEIEAWVTHRRDGTLHLSTSLTANDGGTEMLEQAARDGVPVEGRVTGTNKGGFDVDVLGKRGFCPFSQIAIGPSEPEDHVGRTYRFLVQRVSEDGRDVVVSRAALLREEREAAAVDTLETLQVDDELEGCVTRLMDFGAFVDIGGVEGLVHVSELGWARVDHPREIVSEGDTVRVRVTRLENLDDPRNRRIGLSMRAMQTDPWVETASRLTVGTTTSGTVARLESFGAFVDLEPGVDGLVHISEISPGRRIGHPREVVSVGDTVQVQVIKVDPMRRQIGLSMKALMDDPWSIAASKLRPGTTVQGTVDAIKPFGVFIALEGGVTGLLPTSQFAEDERHNALSRFRPGTPIEARVLDVDPAKQRLTLTRRDDSEAVERAQYADYQASTSDEGGLGTFADLLKKRAKN